MEKFYLKPYNYSLQLITSWAWIIDENVENIKVKTVDSGLLEHLLEQVTELQEDLEIIFRELIPLRHEATPLPEAIDLDRFLRKSKLSVKHLTSEHEKLTDLMVSMKDIKLEHSSPAKVKATTVQP